MGALPLHHWMQSLMEAILACQPAVSEEWLAGWQFPVYYDVCDGPHSNEFYMFTTPVSHLLRSDMIGENKLSKI